MKRKLVPLLARLRKERPDVVVDDVAMLIAAQRIRVGGVVIHNMNARVDASAALVVDVENRELRGTIKLRHALGAFGVDVAGRVCLDVGASTGGFTLALLERGARKVFAVDVGAGQLLGSLRLDARVVNLERTNLADAAGRISEQIDVVTMDLSYLAVSRALPQLHEVDFAPGCVAIVLVKPMFELALADAPVDVDDPRVDEAVRVACIGIESAGWRVTSTMRSRVTGARGAVEHFVLATRA